MNHINEIGGGYWLSSDVLKESLSKHHDTFYFCSTSEQHISTCRSALRFIANDFEKRVVLIPVFTCITVIDPFLQNDWKVIPYIINCEDLSVDWEDLYQKIVLEQPSLILFHSLFGFPTVNNPSLITWIRSQGIKVVNDMTCSLLSSFKRIESDYTVASIRKWFPIPDGGLFIGDGNKMYIPQQYDKELTEAKIKAFQTKDAYLSGIDMNKRDMLSLFDKATIILNSRSQEFAMSPISKSLITEESVEAAKNRRRNNYNRLYEHIKKLSYLHLPLSRADKTVVPYMLPVIVKDRSKLQNYLSSRQVYATVLWTKPEAFSRENCSLYESILCFPINQCYEMEDMDMIGRLLSVYPNE